MEKEADRILDNIVELAALLDEETLTNADLPVVELAKCVTIKKLAGTRQGSRASLSLRCGQNWHPTPEEAREVRTASESMGTNDALQQNRSYCCHWDQR